MVGFLVKAIRKAENVAAIWTKSVCVCVRALRHALESELICALRKYTLHHGVKNQSHRI
jgi:hypothetical protein